MLCHLVPTQPLNLWRRSCGCGWGGHSSGACCQRAGVGLLDRAVLVIDSSQPPNGLQCLLQLPLLHEFEAMVQLANLLALQVDQIDWMLRPPLVEQRQQVTQPQRVQPRPQVLRILSEPSEIAVSAAAGQLASSQRTAVSGPTRLSGLSSLSACELVSQLSEKVLVGP